MIITGEYKEHIKRRVEALRKMYYASGLLFLFLIISEFIHYSHLPGFSFLLVIKFLFGMAPIVFVFFGSNFSGSINIIGVLFSIALGFQLEIWLPEYFPVQFDYFTYKTSIITVVALGLTGVSFFYSLGIIFYIQLIYFITIYSNGIFYFSYFFTILAIFIGLAINSIIHDQYKEEIKLIELIDYWKEYSSQLLSEKLPKDFHLQNTTALYMDITGIYNYYYANQSLKQFREVLRAFYTEFERRRLEDKIHKFDDSKGHFWFLVYENPSNTDGSYANILAEFAIDLKDYFNRHCREKGLDFQLRMGMHSGKYIDYFLDEKIALLRVYRPEDVFLKAQMMEKEGVNGEIQVSQPTYDLLKNRFLFSRRGYTPSDSPGGGVYILSGKKGAH